MSGPIVCPTCWGEAERQRHCYDCKRTGILQCERCAATDAAEEIHGSYYCTDCAAIVEQDYRDAEDARAAHVAEADPPAPEPVEYLDGGREEASLWGRNFRTLDALYDAWDNGEV